MKVALGRKKGHKNDRKNQRREIKTNSFTYTNGIINYYKHTFYYGKLWLKFVIKYTLLQSKRFHVRLFQFWKLL